ncbi:unnamed protein product [[Candida] boidinii]|uniref:ATP-dependent RNA helicase SUV3, mitochondrial n=1 Tax=Candida boidinii TaxID=5477 RepID=A0A9W6T132_CANBO|nr:unnamed protein product [[Candida] boidinii]GMG00360.1 unnamed protein product [[Candida] boidinii]
MSFVASRSINSSSRAISYKSFSSLLVRSYKFNNSYPKKASIFNGSLRSESNSVRFNSTAAATTVKASKASKASNNDLSIEETMKRLKKHKELKDESMKLINDSLHNYKKLIENSDVNSFKYKLSKKHYNIEFLNKFKDDFINKLNSNEIELNLTVKNLNIEKLNTISNLSISQFYYNPMIKNLPLFIYHLLNNKNLIYKLNLIKKNDKIDLNNNNNNDDQIINKDISYIVDLLIEKILYNQMKPFNLQFLYNDASNNQNFNKNLTFNIMDIDNPYEWFPEARKLKRKIVMHVGPTNSGKTYNALKRLENCSKGYFAGPLRLLAREVYDKFQAKGVRCNLVTGEEVIVDVDEYGNRAGLTSGTIEMLSVNDTYDVVVVDEIQMIGDEFRGSAWTNAVLGARAKEIHLCGEISSVPLIKKLVEMTGDELEINEYERLGKLLIENDPVNMSDLKKGDCVVCFSKNAILELKSRIEKETDLTCAVIYGSLPPETRAQEAQRFNDGYYDTVIASDAIGMGLNLKINRVIFTTCQKFNGRDMVPLTNSSIKQIGGRAGRFGVINENGESVGKISAIGKEELDDIRKGIEAPIEYLEKAILWPPENLWIKYYSMFPKNSLLSTVFSKFENDLNHLYTSSLSSQKQSVSPSSVSSSSSSNIKRDFEIASLREKKIISKFFEKEKLHSMNFNILDQLKFINAPSTLGSKATMAYLFNQLFKEFLITTMTRDKKSIFDYNALPLYLTSPKIDFLNSKGHNVTVDLKLPSLSQDKTLNEDEKTHFDTPPLTRAGTIDENGNLRTVAETVAGDEYILDDIPDSKEKDRLNAIKNDKFSYDKSRKIRKPKKFFDNAKLRDPIEDRLMKLEQLHKLIGSYMWISYRFPQSFVDIESATSLKELVEFRISQMLENLRSTPEKNKKYTFF